MDGFFHFGAVVFVWHFAPAEQTGIVQVGMFRRVQAGAGRVVRSGPAFPVVVQVAQHVKILLPTGRTGIEGLAAAKLHTRNNKVQFMVIRVDVPNPKDIALIRLQTSKSRCLKIVHKALLLFQCNLVVGMPTQNSGGELPLGVQRINEVAGGFHIAA